MFAFVLLALSSFEGFFSIIVYNIREKSSRNCIQYQIKYVLIYILRETSPRKKLKVNFSNKYNYHVKMDF
jgi:hypothetical protein